MQAKSSLVALTLVAFFLISPLEAYAQSSPAAPWPIAAQGRSLPRPDWVLAIPARRQADGSLAIWDRNDDWTKEWRVPKVVDGLRIVTLLGDSEDRKRITPSAIDEMLVDQMRPVMDKYGAPALALIVTDGQSTAVAGYVPGWTAAWTDVPYAAGLPETHALSTAAISGMFSEPYSQPLATDTGAEAVEIRAYRQNPETGGMDYKLVLHGTQDMLQYQLNTISSFAGTVVVNQQLIAADQLLVEITRNIGAGPLEADLAAYGLL